MHLREQSAPRSPSDWGQAEDDTAAASAQLSQLLPLPKTLSIVTPCYNEALNVEDLYSQVKQVLGRYPSIAYEHIFIDNASTDATADKLRRMAADDARVKVILNVRNFGHIRSPYHALMQARGDVVILMAADLQDPPALVAEFIEKWRQGYKVVLGVKTTSSESPIFFAIRTVYYKVTNRLADVEIVKNATGFGLYDQCVIEVLRQVDDPYPYFRGLISEIGYESALVQFHQPVRKRGLTSNNFYSLYDIGILGITSHSKVPLRIATLLGFSLSLVSSLTGLGYFIAKLFFWSTFAAGMAPLLIGLMFFASVQLICIGILGEYIGAIHTQVLRRPLVVEKERINFDASPAAAADADAASKKTCV